MPSPREELEATFEGRMMLDLGDLMRRGTHAGLTPATHEAFQDFLIAANELLNAMPDSTEAVKRVSVSAAAWAKKGLVALEAGQ